MKINALNLTRQTAPIRKQLDAAIKKVISSNAFIHGPGVREFESSAAKYCGVKYAVGVSNGTDAISLSLLSLGIKKGEGVLCPAFTYYATAGAVANIGAVPVFADIDERTYNLSLDSARQVLSQKRKIKIKAIIPVHLYGQCADMDRIIHLAKEYKLKVIEDAAQAFGAEYRRKKAGSLGDCGAVSFYPGKNLGAFGDAGMVLTNDAKTARMLRILSNQGNKDRYHHLVLGRNNRMDTIQAVVLHVKLRYLDEWNKKRCQIAQYYNRNLAGSGVELPFVPDYTSHIYHQYVLRSPISNKYFLDGLQSKGIDSRVFYPVPLHLQECFSYLGYKQGDFPRAEDAAKQVFTLPIYPELNRKEEDYIIAAVKELAKR